MSESDKDQMIEKLQKENAELIEELNNMQEVHLAVKQELDNVLTLIMYIQYFVGGH